MSKATTENSPDETKTCPLCGGRVFWFPISNYWGCERCKNTFNRYTVFPDEVKKKSVSAVGNMAAMREALAGVTGILDAFERGTGGVLKSDIRDVIKKAEAALSAPPRNCDVGEAREQTFRHSEYCKKSSMGKGCSQCPLKGTLDCRFDWMQMPYNEEGGAK